MYPPLPYVEKEIIGIADRNTSSVGVEPDDQPPQL